MREKPWPETQFSLSKKEVEDYVDLSLSIERITSMIQEDVMPSRGASAALTNGRIVLVGRKEASLTDVAVVLKSKESNTGDCIVLKLVRKSPLEPQTTAALGNGHADTTPSDSFDGMAPLNKKSDGLDQMFGGMTLKAVSKKSDDLEDMFGGRKLSKKHTKQPLLSLPHHGTMGPVSYVITVEDVRDIFAITKSKIDVNADEVLRGNHGKISMAVQNIQQIDTAEMELMDPISDLKVTRIDIVSLIRERQLYLERMMKFRGQNDTMLGDVVAIVKSEKLLKSRIKQLMDRSGDGGLTQMPEFLLRVKALPKAQLRETGQNCGHEGFRVLRNKQRK
jgi:hypothetical protein